MLLPFVGMAKLGVNEIRDMAKDIILRTPGGIRYSELVEAIISRHPETPKNTIHGSVWDLAKKFPKEISKPSRGLFVGVSSNGKELPPDSGAKKLPNAREELFYQPFAEWLESELEEVTVAQALGGSGLKDKWGTPDVVGVYKPQKWNLVKFEPEIVSVEIKTDPAASVVAFGQAVAYRLFSTKSYLVMPSTITQTDLSRLEALAMLFGVGLVLFEPDPEEPAFSIRVRAQRIPPDMFYVNEFADRLRRTNEEVFEQLFA